MPQIPTATAPSPVDGSGDSLPRTEVVNPHSSSQSVVEQLRRSSGLFADSERPVTPVHVDPDQRRASDPFVTQIPHEYENAEHDDVSARADKKATCREEIPVNEHRRETGVSVALGEAATQAVVDQQLDPQTEEDWTSKPPSDDTVPDHTNEHGIKQNRNITVHLPDSVVQDIDPSHDEIKDIADNTGSHSNAGPEAETSEPEDPNVEPTSDDTGVKDKNIATQAHVAGPPLPVDTGKKTPHDAPLSASREEHPQDLAKTSRGRDTHEVAHGVANETVVAEVNTSKSPDSQPSACPDSGNVDAPPDPNVEPEQNRLSTADVQGKKKKKKKSQHSGESSTAATQPLPDISVGGIDAEKPPHTAEEQQHDKHATVPSSRKGSRQPSITVAQAGAASDGVQETSSGPPRNKKKNNKKGKTNTSISRQASQGNLRPVPEQLTAPSLGILPITQNTSEVSTSEATSLTAPPRQSGDDPEGNMEPKSITYQGSSQDTEREHQRTPRKAPNAKTTASPTQSASASRLNPQAEPFVSPSVLRKRASLSQLVPAVPLVSLGRPEHRSISTNVSSATVPRRAMPGSSPAGKQRAQETTKQVKRLREVTEEAISEDTVHGETADLPRSPASSFGQTHELDDPFKIEPPPAIQDSSVDNALSIAVSHDAVDDSVPPKNADAKENAADERTRAEGPRPLPEPPKKDSATKKSNKIRTQKRSAKKQQGSPAGQTANDEDKPVEPASDTADQIGSTENTDTLEQHGNPEDVS